MNKALQLIDLPKGLILNDLEQEILRGLAGGKRSKDIASQLGIPVSCINQLVSKEKVKEFLQEMIEARNMTLKMELPGLLTQMIEDKIQMAEENEVRLGETTKKDIPDLIRSLTELIKATETQEVGKGEDGFSKIYQQINLIQGGDK